MKTTTYILWVTFFSLFHTLAFAQGEFVVEINKINGAFTKTGPAIAGITWVYPDDRAFNENTGAFIFPSHLVNHCLYSINVSNGSIITNPVIGNIQGFQYDNSSNILYGIEQDNVNISLNFISINSVTGAYTRIGNSWPSSGLYSGKFSTFNALSHTYIFLAPPKILYSIDATNGNVISSPTLVLAPGESIVNFSIDNSSGILYGLLQNNMAQYYLVVIDPATGTNVKIGSGTTFGIGNGNATIDETNQQYIYMYSSPTAGGYVITTLDLATGNVLYNALVQAFVNVDNFSSLKCDNTTAKLYAIHWESEPPPITNAGPDQSITLGYGPQSVTLSGTVTGGTAPYQFLWSDNQTGATIQVSPQVTTTYWLTVTDAENKRASDQVTVSVADCRCGTTMEKVMVCHNGNTLCVAKSAVQAHLDHEDQLGACMAMKQPSLTQIPERITLQQNYPNPFSPVTTITYALSEEGRVVIRILDLFGRVISIVDDRMIEAGTYYAVFDGTGIPAGQYVIQLDFNGVMLYRHMTLIK